MKYIVCDERKDGCGDTFTQEFNDKESAVKEAQPAPEVTRVENK